MTKAHLLICVLLVLLNVGDGLWPESVCDLIGAQGDTKDVLVVAVLILDTVGGRIKRRNREAESGNCLMVNDRGKQNCPCLHTSTVTSHMEAGAKCADYCFSSSTYTAECQDLNIRVQHLGVNWLFSCLSSYTEQQWIQLVCVSRAVFVTFPKTPQKSWFNVYLLLQIRAWGNIRM